MPRLIESSGMRKRLDCSRREFLRSGLAAGAALVGGNVLASETSRVYRPTSSTAKVVSISSGNGSRTTQKAYELMVAGGDPMDAAVEGVVIVEEDPNDMSVGYGGLPNEAGVVELDASVMHGPTMRAGAVGALQNIKTPSRVAREVMRKTDHVMLVGAGALAFARAVGFKEEDLLTDRARTAWLNWKSRLSKEDDWLDEEETGKDFKRPTGTITCLCLNASGELGGCTTTSGLAFKIPGRVGDSPIIGAGLYVDGEVGAAGSTGRGEANIQVSGSRVIVENMKNGMEPMDAILNVLKRVCDQTKSERLLHSKGKPNFNLSFYALRKDGKYAGASIYRGGRFAVNDNGDNKMVDLGHLYDRP